MDINELDEFNEIPGLPGKFTKSTEEGYSNSHEEISLRLTPDGQKYLKDNEEKLAPVMTPLITPAAIIARFVQALADVDRNDGNIMGAIHFANRRAIKEAVPDLPDHALDVTCAYCLDLLLKIYQQNPEEMNKIFGRFGIEVGEAMWGRKNISKEQQ
jgi:hypothetical protein